jgi:purine nucleoside permease
MSSVLVLLMIPGMGLFYSGLAHRKSALSLFLLRYNMRLSSGTNLVTGIAGSNPHLTSARLDTMYVAAITIQI